MILLKNCFYIATFNDKDDELKNHDILIRENVIEKIAPAIQLFPQELMNTEVIDCSRFLVIPGMINTHHHLFQTLTRNLPGAQNAKLFDWLVYLYPIWGRMDEEAIYYSTLLGSAELLKTGATTTTDQMYLYSEDFKGDMMGIQFEAAARAGIRFSPSRGSMTRGESDGGLPPNHVVQNTEEVIRDMVRVIEKFHDSDPLAMRKIVLAPCSLFSVDEDVMMETAMLGRTHSVVIHTHLAETEDEGIYCLEKYGKRPLALMEGWEWLGEDVYFAHGIWFSDDELKVLEDTNTGISHCPTSNMRLGSGIARVKEMLDMGIRVGLGVDGSASNDSSDILGEVRNAMLAQRVKYGPDALTARQALYMAIRNGADLLKLSRLGKIEEGMGADLALYDMFKLQYAGALEDPLAAIVFSGYNHETAYTIVNGDVVVREGKIVGYDEEEIVERVNAIAGRIVG
ncbi:8-oxoguanine deaminase [candidate division KSB1 bacterium]|nr:8-oxoguanine deaminase [candidate division KSB1 bacterium]